MNEHLAVHVPNTRATSNLAMPHAEVRVTPIPGGWSVTASFNESPLVFKSGGRAEQAGRRLALAAAKSGQTVQLQIETRDGRLAEQAHYGAGFNAG